MRHLFYSGIFILAVLSSCCPRDTCIPPPGFTVRFHGFDLTDLDTIYTTGYAIGSDFSQITRNQQIDSVEVSYGIDTTFNITGKTAYALYDDHEWKIYIPSLNRTLYISYYGYRTFSCNKCFLNKGEEGKALATCKLEDRIQDVGNLRIEK
jgi:hypothetical protein